MINKILLISAIVIAPVQANYFCQGDLAYTCEKVEPAPFMYIAPTYIEPVLTPQQIDESLKRQFSDEYKFRLLNPNH